MPLPTWTRHPYFDPSAQFIPIYKLFKKIHWCLQLPSRHTQQAADRGSAPCHCAWRQSLLMRDLWVPHIEPAFKTLGASNPRLPLSPQITDDSINPKLFNLMCPEIGLIISSRTLPELVGSGRAFLGQVVVPQPQEIVKYGPCFSKTAAILTFLKIHH